MKKIYLTFIIALGLHAGLVAQVISIGTDATTPTSGSQYRSPWSAVYDFSYVQTMYLQSEINTSGNITAISYQFSGPSLANSNQVEVYMGITERTAFDGTTYTDWEPLSNLTLVFDGTVSAPTLPGTVTINLTTPYNYQNNGTLIIAIHEKSPGSDFVSGAQGNAFKVTEVGTNRVIYYVTDEVDAADPDPNNPPEADNYRTRVGNIQITFGGVLAVAFKNFTAEKQNNVNKLSWATETEQNNKGFAIQRSTDGIDFNSIGFVNSKSADGNSNAASNYSFIDSRTLKGNSYYRLQQVNFDGKSTYSKVVLVKGKQQTKTLDLSFVYPNPVKDNLNIVLSSLANKKAEVSIINAEGKTVLQTTRNLIAGDNKININLGNFAPGVYSIRAVTADKKESVTARLVKR